jgi:hypothetical protein
MQRWIRYIGQCVACTCKCYQQIMLYVQDCEVIGCAYRDLWIHIALNFMICLRNVPDCCQMSSLSFKLGAISAGSVRHVTLEIFLLENDRGLWIGAGPMNGNIHIHHKNVRSDKICHPQRWWSFWHAEPRCLCVSCLTDCQCTVLQFISAVPPVLHS